MAQLHILSDVTKNYKNMWPYFFPFPTSRKKYIKYFLIEKLMFQILN